MHLIFWGIYLLLSGLSFSNFYPLPYAFSRTVLASSFFALIAYTNIFVLIPRYLAHKRYVQYVGSLLLVILACTVLRVPVEKTLLPEVTLDFLPPRDALRNRPFRFVFSANVMAALFSMLMQFGVDWFENLRTRELLRSEKLEAELKFLKIQLSPHFLFNTLNNIYTLAYLKDDHAAPMIMRLSDSMRYMLYECNEATVPLEKEVRFLQDFLGLSKLKSKNMKNVIFTITDVRPKHRIAPLLLLPFFENAFKHGDVDTNPAGWVRIELTVNETSQMHFRAENTKRETPSNQREASGIGLENVQQQLTLLYPKKHHLVIKNQKDTFLVKLELQLDTL